MSVRQVKNVFKKIVKLKYDYSYRNASIGFKREAL